MAAEVTVAVEQQQQQQQVAVVLLLQQLPPPPPPPPQQQQERERGVQQVELALALATAARNPCDFTRTNTLAMRRGLAIG